jgi:hypothetical protein
MSFIGHYHTLKSALKSELEEAAAILETINKALSSTPPGPVSALIEAVKGILDGLHLPYGDKAYFATLHDVDKLREAYAKVVGK